MKLISKHPVYLHLTIGEAPYYIQEALKHHQDSLSRRVGRTLREGRWGEGGISVRLGIGECFLHRVVAYRECIV